LRPDPTFFIHWPNAKPPVDPAADATEFRAPRLGVALNGSIRHWQFLEQTARWIRGVSSWLDVSLILAHPERDRPQAETLSRLSGASYNKVEYRGCVEEFLAALSRQTALLSFRLHPAIAGLRLGIATATVYPCRGFTDKIATMALPDHPMSGPGPALIGAQDQFLEWLSESVATRNLAQKVLS
ncbi:MAG: hypothetical protein AAB091_03865, partial [Elusimicrobiota bacterium]